MPYPRWQGYTRDDLTETVQIVAGANQAFISITNNKAGTVLRIEQVTQWTVSFPATAFCLTKGINNAPTLPVCATQSNQFPPLTTTHNGLSAVSVATAYGPPYIYLLQGESLITSVLGQSGDTYGAYVLYELGTMY